MFKKVLVHTRRGIKFTILFMIAAFLIVGIIAFLYKPTYSVFIKGEQVGYTGDRTKLQHKINDYVENGDGTNKNVAFVQLADLPEYKLCLLKKDIVTNDDEIFNKIKEEGTTYYRYYAILEDGEEKYYVSKFEDAEDIVKQLKDKGKDLTVIRLSKYITTSTEAEHTLFLIERLEKALTKIQEAIR